MMMYLESLPMTQNVGPTRNPGRLKIGTAHVNQVTKPSETIEHVASESADFGTIPVENVVAEPMCGQAIIEAGHRSALPFFRPFCLLLQYDSFEATIQFLTVFETNA
jgi:hypothetical protein